MADIYPCKGLDLRVELRDSGVVNDLWGWTDPATDVEWVLAGHSDGTFFISLEDPDDPLLLGFLPWTTDSRSAPWRDIKVYKNHAYIVFDFAGEHGMQVFDLRLLRGTSAYRNYSPTYTYDKVHSVHNLAINEETGFAFATGMSSGGQNCGSGLHMVDLSSPAKREFAGCFSYEPEVGNDAPGMYGSWSNYPFFASGIIAVTSMDEGVFLLLPSELRPD